MSDKGVVNSDWRNVQRGYVTMRKRIVAAAGAVAVLGGLAVAGTSAQAADCLTGTGVTNGSTCDVTVTATVGGLSLPGVRTLGPVAPVALAGTSSPATGLLTVPVVEAAAAGHDWSVTAQSSALTSTGGGSIAASNLTVADTAAVASLSGVGCLLTNLGVNPCTITGGGTTARALDSAQTLMSATGENSNTAYTGTYPYTGTLSLNVPNGTPAGAYTGKLTLTLVQ